ncbi:hypothetical protein [Vibrio agarivorans]|uniref:ATP-binding protein n=1 Tax=Vibrio agarivorans TaxID=153622 RepID=A0ABT7XZA9_9VIBR|nr:hypothetical protein [Vibrio agarivorans]MDN2481118.1 hypothetical protein [Vibrio agarivorans]
MAKKAQPLKLPSPKNANQTLPALHTVYVAGTGGGKTTAIKKLNLVPRGAQVVFFDPYENYCTGKFKGQNVQRFTEFAPFARALVAARAKNSSFKCALVKPATMENLEMFAAIVWSVGDGFKKPLHVVIEELGSAAETSTKLNGRAGELWRGGRQFGLVVHSAFQRTQEVPKTVITQSTVWWVGPLSSLSDAKAINTYKGVSVEVLSRLKSPKDNHGIAEYLLIKEGIDNMTEGKLACN